MTTKPLIILLVAWLLTVQPGVAQEYSYSQYNMRDGLAGATVYHGLEDREGFLWFATETGVSRFDGTSFRNYTTADGLPDNEIIRMFADSKGRVWMIPFRSSICYYWRGRIYNQENDSVLKKISPINGFISDIAEDSSGNIWLIAPTHLFTLQPSGVVRDISQFDGINFAGSAGGTNDAGHFSFALTVDMKTSLVELDGQGKMIKREPLSFKPILHNQITPSVSIYRNKDSAIFLTQGKKVKKTVLVPPDVNGFSIIDDSTLSINTGNGAYYYNYRQGILLSHILPGRTINATFRDREGNSWFVTNGNGIFRIPSLDFRNYTYSKDGKNYYPIFSIQRFDSIIYAGSDRSTLFRIYPQTGRLEVKPFTQNSTNLRIMAMEKMAGRLLIGTNLGIYRMDGSLWSKSLNVTVKSFQKLGEDRLVVGIQNSVLLFNEKDYEILQYTYRSTSAYRLNKRLYFGSLNGLYSKDDSLPVWLGRHDKRLQSRVGTILPDRDSTLWIATHGSGIICLRNDSIIRNIRVTDGLSSNIVRTLYLAGNTLWAGTDRGLNRIVLNDSSQQITTFTTSDGLLADVINAIYVEGSQVYVGTAMGVTVFDTEKIARNSICDLRITGIQATGINWPTDTTGFTLPPRNNAIRFDFTGISYRSAGDITYRYRLKGLQDEWQTTREHSLNFLALSSGDYELELVAINKFGLQSTTLHVPFRVEKLFWETNLFRIFFIMLVWALIWFFVNARIKRVRRQHDEKMQISTRMAELEQMALKAQMNPHFIFNSLNSVQQYVIDKDLLGANKFITEFSRLIRLTLDISSRTQISIEEEMNYLATYLELEKSKFEDKFTFSVKADDALYPADWFIPPMILQPYVENSIRHGVRYRPDRLGHIRVTFRLDDQYLVCEVEDNGVGRAKTGQYKSHMPIEYQSKGMTLTARRIEMLNKHQANSAMITIEDLVEDGKATGTRVILRFPVEASSGRKDILD